MTPSDDPKPVSISSKNPIPDLAKAIQSCHYFARDAGDGLYVYRNGVYRPGGEHLVDIATAKMLALQKAKVPWVPQKGRDTAALIKLMAPRLWDRPPMDRINLLNGIYDIKEKILLPHSPSFLSATQLPINYDPEAKSVAWRQFAHDVLPEDAQETIWELAAWFMLPNMDFQKALLLLGGRGTGKSTLLGAIRAFLGEENVAIVSLQTLEKSRFHMIRLIGKLVCMCPDNPTDEMVSMAMFKAITGGDPVPAEYKMGKIFDILPYARLAFSANEPPTTKEKSGADVERWIIIRMDHKFRNIPQKRRELNAALVRPEELSGVLNEALRVLPKVLVDGITITQSMEQESEQLRAVSNPEMDWVVEHLIADDESFVPSNDLFQAISSEFAISPKALAEILKRAFPSSYATKRWVRGVERRVWTGVRWVKPDIIQ